MQTRQPAVHRSSPLPDTSIPPADPRLIELVQLWTEDAIRAGEIQELEALLRRHPDGPRLFAELTHLEHCLRGLGPRSGKEVARSHSALPFRASRLTGAEILAVAALVAMAVAVLGVLFPGRRGEPVPSHPSDSPAAAAVFAGVSLTPMPCATLTHTMGARWASPSPPLREGDHLLPGRFHLGSGLAQVQFLSGAKLVLEGPADFEARSASSVVCRSGRFYAAIPRTGAFVLETPAGLVIDTGAELGLQIDPAGRIEIHVFQGRVVFRTPGEGEVVPLNEGQAAVLGHPEGTKLFSADAGRFVADGQFMERYALHRERAHNEWYFASLNWRRDARLLAFLDFDGADHLRGIVPALTGCPTASQTIGEAIVIGAGHAEGRWPGKTALAFTGPNQRIRVQLSGHHDALTLLMWVRPTSLPDRFCSLLVSDGFDFGASHRSRLGSVHWTIHGRTSQFRLQTRRHPGEEATYVSTLSPPETLQPGQWSQLACVYDRLQNRVAHFINGAPAGASPLQVNVRLEIGVADIGNCSDSACPSGYFPGIIDEVSIYRAALPPGEIRALYELGEP